MYRVIDLFSGAGGFSLGMAMAGFHVRTSIEYDHDAMATFKANHSPEDLMTFRADVQKFDTRILDFTRGIDVVVGGPPCQPFSEAGRQDPLDDRANLFKDYVTLLRAVERPYHNPISAFIMENVEGLVRVRDGADLKAIQQALENCGYHLSTRVLDAYDYGVPQRRRRLFIVGSKFPGFEFPDPVAPCERRTLRDAIGALPPPTDDGQIVIDGKLVTGHRAVSHKQSVVDRIRLIPEGGRLRDLGLADTPRSFPGSYARLNWDRPSQTITRNFSKPSSARCIHPEQHRGLTIREAARLQTFPDDFNFEGRSESVKLQIGNAVPPVLAMHLGLALRRHLEANGVPFQDFAPKPERRVPVEDLPWFLTFKQDEKFREMLRKKAEAKVQV